MPCRVGKIFYGYAWKYVGEVLKQVIHQIIQICHGQLPVLVGASWGGLCSIILEGTYQLSKAVILVDITHEIEAAGAQRVVGFMQSKPNGFATLEEAADAVAMYQPHRKKPRDLSGLKKNLKRSEDGSRYVWKWDTNFLNFEWHAKETEQQEELKKLAREIEDQMRRSLSNLSRVPVLLIRAQHSDIVSDSTVQKFLQILPHADFVTVENARHMVAGDSNDEFTQTVLQYIDRKVFKKQNLSDVKSKL